MRIASPMFAFALCAASVGFAHGQAASSDAARVSSGSSRIPSSVSFTYDAKHGQISSSGVGLRPAGTAAAAVTPTTGKIIITINTKIVSGFTAGTTYHCSAYVVGGLIDLNTFAVAGGIETVNGFARVVSPGLASCTLTIPYSWTLPSGPGSDTGLIIAYGVGAINTEDEVQRSTLQVDGVENLPASTATEKFTFDVAL